MIVRSLQAGLLGPVRGSRPTATSPKFASQWVRPPHPRDHEAIEVIVGASSCHSPEHDAETRCVIRARPT